MRLLLFAFLFVLSASARADIQSLLQLIDYVGVDYPEAVENGEVINDFEYAEMQEFAGRIAGELRGLPPSAVTDLLAERAGDLEKAVNARADAARIAAMTRELREILLANFNVALTPRSAPDLARGARLYAEHCAGCHGADGRGEGPAAQGLDPPPTDFTDGQRARQRSLFGLYNTITLGVEGTGMTSFSQLPDADRWALAFYVGGLYAGDADRAGGAEAFGSAPLSLADAVALSPAELEMQRKGGAALAAWVRANPSVLFAGKPGPVDTAIARMEESLERFRAGDRAAAARLALEAYLEGFELAEAALSNISLSLMRETEAAMLGYRQALEKGAGAAEIEERHAQVMAYLAQSQTALGSGSLAGSVAFTSSLVILLREGMEAILIIGAMVAFLVRTGRTDAIRYVHAGWVLALLAGAVTWVVSSYLFSMSGATRELTEGITALLAAAILFYVGFWLHGNASVTRWNRYVRSTMETALSRETLWALALVSFLAVYREAFETVLFYQALWAQVAADGRDAVVGGGLVAAVILAAVAWAILRYGVRLPLRPFFLVTAVLMIVLAVVLAGKGVMALQEAGKLPVHTIPVPRIEILGIYPTLQSVALQCALVIAAVVVAVLQRRRAA